MRKITRKEIDSWWNTLSINQKTAILERYVMRSVPSAKQLAYENLHKQYSDLLTKANEILKLNDLSIKQFYIDESLTLLQLLTIVSADKFLTYLDSIILTDLKLVLRSNA